MNQNTPTKNGRKSYYFATALLGLIVTTALVGITSFAASTDSDQAGQRPEQARFEHRETGMEAVINGDYDSWKVAMEQKVSFMRQQADEMENKINSETFDKLTQIHQFMTEGKTEEAKTLRDELGMGGFGPGMMGQKHGGPRIEQQQNSGNTQ